MTPSHWDRLEQLLAHASDLPVDQQQAFIARATSDDPALGAELTALLAASSGADRYVERLRADVLGSVVPGLLRDASAADGPDPWVGRTVSHYEITERIGGGGMGVIYRAQDTRLNRTVALKFIAPEIRNEALVRERFLQEARAASALDHPNICTIHEIGETDDGRLFIVMPAYEGETLRSRLTSGALPEGEAMSIARQVALALAAAHGRGIVHRDVKPDNIFLTRGGVVKLLDFGLARADDGTTAPTGGAGTIAYMSPEQAAGQRAEARSDVWALGVILYEMVSGRRPFTASDPRALLDDIRRGVPAAPPAPFSAPMDRLLQRVLVTDPARRLANGQELLKTVDEG